LLNVPGTGEGQVGHPPSRPPVPGTFPPNWGRTFFCDIRTDLPPAGFATRLTIFAFKEAHELQPWAELKARLRLGLLCNKFYGTILLYKDTGSPGNG
jgi:hypothetical protein